MSLAITRHQIGSLLALGREIGDPVRVAAGDAPYVIPEPAFYCITAEGDCRVRVADGSITDAENGVIWYEGAVSTRILNPGDKIAVGEVA